MIDKKIIGYGLVVVFAISAIGISVALTGSSSENNIQAEQYRMTQNASDILSQRWYDEVNGGDEYSYCLDIERDGDVLTFSNPQEREYTEANPSRIITTGTCEYGYVHPHFNNDCTASVQDAFTFGRNSDVDEFSMIQCGPTDFRVYYTNATGNEILSSDFDTR